MPTGYDSCSVLSVSSRVSCFSVIHTVLCETSTYRFHHHPQAWEGPRAAFAFGRSFPSRHPSGWGGHPPALLTTDAADEARASQRQPPVLHHQSPALSDHNQKQEPEIFLNSNELSKIGLLGNP